MRPLLLALIAVLPGGLVAACANRDATAISSAPAGPEVAGPRAVMAGHARPAGEADPVVVPPTYVPGFPGSTLATAADGAAINTWVGTPGLRWKRCYSKSADGGNSVTFHAACDNKGPSISLARLSTGKVIGAYASKSWASTGSWMGDEGSFLFSLTNGFKHTYTGNSPHYTQYSAANYGPTFGGGHDWHVNGDLKSGYCYMGYTFICRIGNNGGLDTVCRNDFCGSYDGWQVLDLEVWLK